MTALILPIGSILLLLVLIACGISANHLSQKGGNVGIWQKFKWNGHLWAAFFAGIIFASMVGGIAGKPSVALIGVISFPLLILALSSAEQLPKSHPSPKFNRTEKITIAPLSPPPLPAVNGSTWAAQPKRSLRKTQRIEPRDLAGI